MRHRVPAVTCAAIMICVLPLLTGCNDDDCPTCGGGKVTATLANVWPHADGNAWTYAGTYTEATLPDGIGWQEGNPLPLPSMEDLHAALQQAPGDSVTGETDFTYRLAFAGNITTESGATGQHLTSTVFLPAPGKAGAVEARTGDGDPLLQLVARARPDLREAIRDRYGLADKDLLGSPRPLFLGGYAFAYEDSGYYSYGDLDLLHSWTYLQDGVEPGTAFSQQLIPAIANDVWLYGRVWSVGDVTVGGRTFPGAVECMYVVDLGEQMVTDETGASLGTFHGWMSGTIVYAPEVGPVAARERSALGPSLTVQGPPQPGMFDYVLDLAGATTAE